MPRIVITKETEVGRDRPKWEYSGPLHSGKGEGTPPVKSDDSGIFVAVICVIVLVIALFAALSKAKGAESEPRVGVTAPDAPCVRVIRVSDDD